MLTKQLTATAVTIGSSASSIENALIGSTTTTKSALDSTSKSLIAALHANMETGTKNAEVIKAQIAALTSNLEKASADIQAAGVQSSRLSSRLNLLTFALVVAAILTAGATVFQAVETKRQADVADKQLNYQISSTKSNPHQTDSRTK